MYTNPTQDSTGKTQKLGTLVISSSTATTIELVASCLVDGYSGDIHTLEGDTLFKQTTPSGAILYNNGEFK